MKTIIFLLLTFSYYVSNSQSYDIKYNDSIYVSYFSKTYKNPVLVAYKLYKGGGDASRTGMTFKGNINTANNNDYSGTKDETSGIAKYDIGHLCNAEDFAFNSVLEEKTFRFYNAVPQLANLNRGTWKHNETEIRTISQNDSLLIICYNVFTTNKLNNSDVYIPDYCIKIVKSLSKGKILFSLKFKNENHSTPENIPVDTLIKTYKLNIVKTILKTNCTNIK